MTAAFATTALPAALVEALKPFLEVEAATHKGEYSPELDDDDYISVYHHDIRAKHFRALKKAVDQCQAQ